MSIVLVSSDKNLRQEIFARSHEFAADEPLEVGGDDTGPTPYELLLAALGACTSMTLFIYARRKEWPLENVEVRLEHSRVHARDCTDCEQKEGYLDHIDKQIVVHGALSAEQVERLGQIAEMCPVNKTLHASVHTSQQIRCAGVTGS